MNILKITEINTIMGESYGIWIIYQESKTADFSDDGGVGPFSNIYQTFVFILF